MGMRRDSESHIVHKRRSITPRCILGLDPARSALKARDGEGSVIPGFAIDCDGFKSSQNLYKLYNHRTTSVVDRNNAALNTLGIQSRGHAYEEETKTGSILEDIKQNSEQALVDLRAQEIRLAVLEANKPIECRRGWRKAVKSRLPNDIKKLDTNLYLQWWRSAFYTSGKDVHKVILEDIATQKAAQSERQRGTCQACSNEQKWAGLATKSQESSLVDIWGQGYTNMSIIMDSDHDVVIETMRNVHDRPLTHKTQATSSNAWCKVYTTPRVLRQRSSDVVQGAKSLKSRVVSGKNRIKQWSIARRPSFGSRGSL
ncbi:hypothetical protein SARC_08136 [Sphaeroforma arctica JP610]|uniref:Uncharacterized protein n=1 Tax=Sphaeroforma arctica JP610 TaxID=667725 RepID=A0A0L0FRS8_9EUKA|nr:hypothetical protein SARC_08136 [Sphaeroforma arctica JP610]KNC79470.1 hypothetical protein SARC_08136 [Sphaeroforma arctica JP610]|eukprot:XP_014153372.1 hypothetical protein SARC_08136 [Sphaeroforma arctica JP610]